MAQRLPIPGSDDNSWGDILNGFLGVVHNADGTLKTNTTLSQPDVDFVDDTNGNKEIELVATSGTANWVRLTNTAQGNGVTIGVNGTGSNENLSLAALGSGTVQVGGSQVTTAANTQTLSAKTISGSNNTLSAIPESAITNLTSDLAGKQPNITLTTSGTSGAATFSSNTLNIPNYAVSSLTQAASQTANFTAAAGNLYPVNANSAAVTVSLPTSTGGQLLIIKKTDSSINTVTLSGTINGTSSSTYAITKQNQSKELFADGGGGWTLAAGDLDLTTLGATSTSAGIVQLAGDLTGTAANPALVTTGVTAGTYGSSTVIPSFTVDAKGRITAVTAQSPSALQTYTTSNTLNSYVGQWTKIATQSVTVQYQDTQVILLLQAYNDGELTGSYAEVRLRTKQQNAFGNNPYVDAAIVGSSGTITTSNIIAVITQNTPSTSVDFYVQITEYNRAYNMSILSLAQVGSAATQVLAGQSFVSTVPAGVSQQTAKYDQAIPASSSLIGGIKLTGDLAGTAASPAVAKLNGVTLSGTAPTTGQVLQATSGTGAAWTTVNPGGLTQAAIQTSSFTAANGNFYPVNASSGAVTVTLPASSGSQMFVVKKTDSSANFVTLSGTINGTSSTTVNLSRQNQAKELIADGGGGWTIALGDLDIATTLATPTTLGFVQLAGDLGGTAAVPRVPALAPLVLTPTTTKTSAYTANAQDLVLVDATNGGFTITLPSAPTDSTEVEVKKVDSTANVITVSTGGSDTFVIGGTSLALAVQGQAVTWRYQASSSKWIALSNDLPLTSTDTRYLTQTNAAATYATQSSLTSYAVNPNSIGIPIVGTNGITVTETSSQIAIGYSGSGSGSGGISRTISQVTAAATAGATAGTDYVYWWSGSTAYTLTLPTAASNTNRYTLKNSSTVGQTVNTTSSQTIEGGTSITISANNSVDVISNGSNWMVI